MTNEAMNFPMMTGTEKQIAWAKDILESPYRVLGARAESRKNLAAEFDKASENGGARERLEAEAYLAAQSRYAADIATLPKEIKASDIIDKRAAFGVIAHNILKDEYVKHGFAAYEAQSL